MAGKLNNYVDKFRTQLCKDAEVHLSQILPQRLQAVTEVLKSPFFDIGVNLDRVKQSALDSISTNSGGNNSKIPYSSIEVASNSSVIEAYDTVKPFLLQLGEDAQLLRIWVALNIPKIEDGNNFGVSVQEEVMLDASKTESDVATILDFYSDYLLTRGKISTKIIKWPGVKAFTDALIELDEMTFVRIRMTLQDIRNNYARLYDLCTKNINKILNPRSTSGLEAVNSML
ncbi:unnamed protein product [Hymenolepis diminuta]|uniref:PA28_beta domain-containing protein n=1 Tax=Hymenolepis diminuta TaxID=6216 RepID=A0A0R3SQT0_HYMDI|nr:unnamed protein product [Hymenolepis diminuta]VUZ40115.1 unnamed protein product [Hymenolepis diminuta]